MNNVSEICVVIKDEEKTLRKKFLIYDIFQVSEDDQTIKDCIKETLENFDGEPSSIKVIITMDLQ